MFQHRRWLVAGAYGLNISGVIAAARPVIRAGRLVCRLRWGVKVDGVEAV